MKIAIITDDGKTISKHFGRAAYYLVVTLSDGKICDKELREKLGHAHFGGHAHDQDDNLHDHGNHAESHKKHLSMAETISDCEAVICGGMGMGVYQSLQTLNIKPIVTIESDISSVIELYLSGSLVDHTELLH